MDSTLNEEFLRTLHEEKSNSMMERSKYSRDKIVFILGIVGFGSLNFRVSGINSSTILYIVPLVAFGYDLYINATDEGIKRIGAFLRSNSSYSTVSEKNYEKYAKMRRGIYAPIANVIFSLTGTVGAAVIALLTEGVSLLFLWCVAWSTVAVIMVFVHKKQIIAFDSDNVEELLEDYEKAGQDGKKAEQ